MVEIITGVTLAARVAFFIASYRGYKAESKKEDDRAVRNWIMESINGLRNRAVNLMETGYRNDDDNLEREALGLCYVDRAHAYDSIGEYEKAFNDLRRSAELDCELAKKILNNQIQK